MNFWMGIGQEDRASQILKTWPGPRPTGPQKIFWSETTALIYNKYIIFNFILKKILCKTLIFFIADYFIPTLWQICWLVGLRCSFVWNVGGSASVWWRRWGRIVCCDNRWVWSLHLYIYFSALDAWWTWFGHHVAKISRERWPKYQELF